MNIARYAQWKLILRDGEYVMPYAYTIHDRCALCGQLEYCTTRMEQVFYSRIRLSYACAEKCDEIIEKAIGDTTRDRLPRLFPIFLLLGRDITAHMAPMLISREVVLEDVLMGFLRR
jgi:hypothetical protein